MILRAFVGKRLRWVVASLGLGLVLFLGVLIVHQPTRHRGLRWLGHSLDVGVPPAKSNAIWILNGDRDTRPFKAAEFFHDGWTDQVIVTTTRPLSSVTDFEVPEDQRVIRVLSRCGVPKTKITRIDCQCLSTFDEAVAANDWLKQFPDGNLTVVTNAYHTGRASWVFQRVVDEPSRIRWLSAPNEGFGPDNWWKHIDGFNLYGAEIAKTALYRILYGNWGYGLVVLVCLGLTVIGALRWRTSSSKNGISATSD